METRRRADAVVRTRKLLDMKGYSNDRERCNIVIKEWQMAVGLYLKVVKVARASR
jgi:hypothetical protein